MGNGSGRLWRIIDGCRRDTRGKKKKKKCVSKGEPKRKSAFLIPSCFPRRVSSGPVINAFTPTIPQPRVPSSTTTQPGNRTMPGLIRPPPTPFPPDHDPPNLTSITRHPTPPPNHNSLKPLKSSFVMAPSVRYIPSQMDPLSSTSTEAARKSPFRLFIQDARVLFTMLPYLPCLFLPFWTSDPRAELYVSAKNLRDMVLQGLLFVIEILVMVLVVPAFLVLPGAVFAFATVVVGGVVWALTKVMEGPTVVYSRMDDRTVESSRRHPDERWFFINGCTTR